MNSGSSLIFPEFDDIKVSTKTIIAVTNVSLNIQKLYELLPITEYIVVQKRRGRKKKIEKIDPNRSLESGSIITLQYENNIRGVDLKKKDDTKVKRFFRNSLTVVMIIEGKTVNFKTSRNGKFQITGCKTDEQAELCLKFLWEYIYKIPRESEIFKFNSSDPEPELEILFVPAMRNIDFSLGFYVDRDKLSDYIVKQTENHSWIEASFGYTGVNIKFLMKDDISLLEIKKLRFQDGVEWIESMVPYTDFLDNLPKKEIEKKLSKNRYNTFLVFHSGRTIFSGMTEEFMRGAYYEFLDIIRECYDEIREKLIV